jgi:hypothetical protein
MVKTFRGRMPQTVVSLTPEGRVAIQQHWQRLEALRVAANAFKQAHKHPQSE